MIARKSRRRQTWLALLVAVGCSGGSREGETGPAPGPQLVASVAVALGAGQLNVGETTTASATLRDAQGNTLTGRVVVWASSNTSVATLTESGLSITITAVASGSTMITATCEGVIGAGPPLVVNVQVASVTVSLAATQLPLGQATSATATLRDAQGNVVNGRQVAWTSSAASVATVGGSGTGAVVTAVRQGTVTIAATSEGAQGNAQLLVTTPPLVELSVGGLHTCGLTAAGAAFCWGFNQSGQLGNGNLVNRLVPTLVEGATTFASISAGFAQTCGTTDVGTGYCWGNNSILLIGDSTFIDRLVPTVVRGGLRFAKVVAGGFNTCGRTTAGAAYCWGVNYHGQLGNGDGGPRAVPAYTPALVLGGLTFVRLSAGGSYECGLTTAGVAWCWGLNYDGSLGDGTTELYRTMPTLVSGGLSFVDISAGGHTCARTSTGVAYCWGSNASGQVGDGTMSFIHTTPTLVAGGLRFAEISVGGDASSCGRTTDGVAYCWGDNRYGQLGDGTTTNRFEPTLVAGGLTFLQIAVGGDHVCGRATTGIFCWGGNTYGQLGDGTTVDRLVPTRVR